MSTVLLYLSAHILLTLNGALSFSIRGETLSPLPTVRLIGQSPSSDARARINARPFSDSFRLTTTASGDEDQRASRRERLLVSFRKAGEKFRKRPGTYLIIPFIAAFVGWFTNWLAVQMIFYPVEFRGIDILRKDEVPLGLLGWQGIVPCKTRKMSDTMVTMVTTQLLNVQEVFRRLDPKVCAELLAPEVPKLGQDILDESFPSWLAQFPKTIFDGLPTETVEWIRLKNLRFLRGLTIGMQDNIDSLLSVKNCVINQMMQDRSLLGILFKKCGQAELDFLTNSGLWFGFLLGLIQMVVALFWDNPWSLSIGGCIVGLATNWLALKWIFEPVNPTKFGPFVLQGMFLKRQKEVAAEFSTFFAKNVLNSKELWNSILTDPETQPAFHKLFTAHLLKFVSSVTGALQIDIDPAMMSSAAKSAIVKFPDHIHVLHDYVNEKLGLRETLRVQMEKMSSAQFEQVLHPIFQEDELTLIIAGGILGLIAGLIQQGLETGTIQLPTPKQILAFLKSLPSRIRNFQPVAFLKSVPAKTKAKLTNLFRRNERNMGGENDAKNGDDEGIDNDKIK
ncbi:MAG: hypothetical protein L7S62_04155 [Flavobacteriales bacterium]|nr:hypothetical protein [Flavobacteriales bacterium]